MEQVLTPTVNVGRVLAKRQSDLSGSVVIRNLFSGFASQPTRQTGRSPWFSRTADSRPFVTFLGQRADQTTAAASVCKLHTKRAGPIAGRARGACRVTASRGTRRFAPGARAAASVFQGGRSAGASEIGASRDRRSGKAAKGQLRIVIGACEIVASSQTGVASEFQARR